jgi:hypothetical protein
MPRQPMTMFGEGTEVVRVYLAAELAEAQRAETSLESAGLTWAAEVETFFSRTLIGSSAPRQGVGLWILEADLDAACAALERDGLVRGLVDRG